MARLASLAFASALATAAAGCPDHSGGSGMIVVANSAPQGTTCAFTGDITQPTLSQGLIEATSPNAYLLTPLIESRITSPAGQEPIHTIEIEGADITLSESDTSGGLNQIAQYTSLAAGSILPSAYTNITLPLIPTSILQNYKTATTQTVLEANITLYGTEGGGRIQAEPFIYGVTLCNGCIVDTIGSCKSFTATVRPGNPCNPFQDGQTDCCTTDSGGLTCPAVMD